MSLDRDVSIVYFVAGEGVEAVVAKFAVVRYAKVVPLNPMTPDGLGSSLDTAAWNASVVPVLSTNRFATPAGILEYACLVASLVLNHFPQDGCRGELQASVLRTVAGRETEVNLHSLRTRLYLSSAGRVLKVEASKE